MRLGVAGSAFGLVVKSITHDKSASASYQFLYRVAAKNGT